MRPNSNKSLHVFHDINTNADYLKTNLTHITVRWYWYPTVRCGYTEVKSVFLAKATGSPLQAVGNEK